ncbi:MAG: hypothetical protein C5B50_12135 [Verrucomicrobia bacterium]|nr:MAG: hypothetical protein C5B50_12135 [Verrucomicrobiota bacterium]
MTLFPAILAVVVLLIATDAVRWKVVTTRELKRRNLVRVRSRYGAKINPAKGFRLIGICTCERDGKKYRVFILNHGWFRTRPVVEIDEI